MIVEQGAAEANVKIRPARRDWIWIFGCGGFLFAYGALDRTIAAPGSTASGAIGCVFVAEALWIRTFGVDLTREAANIRGLRRRSIPWRQVQAVLRHQQLGAMRVSLILENGKRVTLKAPTTWWGLGEHEYEADFNRIGQWWLAHRGESWRPVRPEAPRPPVQG